jgi:predicted NodU family carbamoyl transferase
MLMCLRYHAAGGYSAASFHSALCGKLDGAGPHGQHDLWLLRKGRPVHVPAASAADGEQKLGTLTSF